VLKQLQGKNGTNGTNGANGAPGTPGPAGKDGANGTNGKDGVPGESVKIKVLAKKSACEEGGSEFTAGSEKGHACNGSPWTAGGTLPSGKTETGTWVLVSAVRPEGLAAQSPISFPIPLAEGLGSGEVHYVTKGEWETKKGPAQCPGNPSSPEAEKGNLCVYETNAQGVAESSGHPTTFLTPPGAYLSALGAGTSGDVLVFTSASGTEVSQGIGTWAVTAP
jgi:hypothetical protein